MRRRGINSNPMSHKLLNDYKVAERIFLESTVSGNEKFALFYAVHKQNVKTPKDDYSMISVLLRGYAWLKRTEQQILGHLNAAAFLNKLYWLFSGWQSFHATALPTLGAGQNLANIFLKKRLAHPSLWQKWKQANRKKFSSSFFFTVSRQRKRDISFKLICPLPPLSKFPILSILLELRRGYSVENLAKTFSTRAIANYQNSNPSLILHVL